MLYERIDVKIYWLFYSVCPVNYMIVKVDFKQAELKN